MYIYYEINCDVYSMYSVFSFLCCQGDCKWHTYLTSLPCKLNYISCDAINVEKKVLKNLYQIELLPFVLEDPWTSKFLYFISVLVTLHMQSIVLVFILRILENYSIEDNKLKVVVVCHKKVFRAARHRVHLHPSRSVSTCTHHAQSAPAPITLSQWKYALETSADCQSCSERTFYWNQLEFPWNSFRTNYCQQRYGIKDLV